MSTRVPAIAPISIVASCIALPATALAQGPTTNVPVLTSPPPTPAPTPAPLPAPPAPVAAPVQTTAAPSAAGIAPGAAVGGTPATVSGDVPPGGPYPAPIDDTHTYTVASAVGPVSIDRAVPTEVGRWGWSWFGNHNWLPGVPGAPDQTISMVGVRHWLTDKYGFEGAAGIVVDGTQGPTYTCFGLQGAGLYSLARYEYLNVFAAGRLLIVPYGNPSGGVSVFQFGMQGEVAAEFFLDGLQLFHSGPMVRTSRSLSVTVGIGLGFDFTKFSGGGGSVSGAKFATTGASDIANGTTSGTVALTYYF
jgi:hypothetical protein